MKTYRGTVVLSYYQEVVVEANTKEEAELKMFDKFQLHNAHSESEVCDLEEVK